MSDVSVSSALAQAIADEQVVVDRAYRELDTQIAQARKTLSATEARGASGTHQARGERDAFAAHYANRIATLEGVEHRLVLGVWIIVTVRVTMWGAWVCMMISAVRCCWIGVPPAGAGFLSGYRA